MAEPQSLKSLSPKLLSIVELGGYASLAPLYQAAGFDVLHATAMRKALALLKKLEPAVVVAEFNFQSDFRDRTSSLESLLATLQTRAPQARVIVLYDPEQRPHLDRLLARFTVHATLSFPIDTAALQAALTLNEETV